MQVSETYAYIKRNMDRYYAYYTSCPRYPHLSACVPCQPFFIGFQWWLDRLLQMEMPHVDFS